VHLDRTGDPIKLRPFDNDAETKTQAEAHGELATWLLLHRNNKNREKPLDTLKPRS